MKVVAKKTDEYTLFKEMEENKPYYKDLFKIKKVVPCGFYGGDNFNTPDDIDTETKKAKYEYGLEIGKKSKLVIINCAGSWNAQLKDISWMFPIASYEVIGVNAYTAHLLQGFLDSGVEIRVFRYSDRNENGSSYRWNGTKLLNESK